MDSGVLLVHDTQLQLHLLENTVWRKQKSNIINANFERISWILEVIVAYWSAEPVIIGIITYYIPVLYYFPFWL